MLSSLRHPLALTGTCQIVYTRYFPVPPEPNQIIVQGGEYVCIQFHATIKSELLKVREKDVFIYLGALTVAEGDTD